MDSELRGLQIFAIINKGTSFGQTHLHVDKEPIEAFIQISGEERYALYRLRKFTPSVLADDHACHRASVHPVAEMIV